MDVLDRLTKLELPIIVVNDGSTDQTVQFLMKWQNSTGMPTTTKIVVGHSKNLGKAAALQIGFSFASGKGYTHAATIDSDGQLDPEQIPEMLALAEDHPEAFVLGIRDARQHDYPVKSRWGRKISNSLIWRECGHCVQDSQCGLRIYSLSMVSTIKCKVRPSLFAQ
jgi:glycosyltransferase involved in cell wall biosynthesis